MKFNERINRELADITLPGVFVLNDLMSLDEISLKLYIYMKFLAKNSLEYELDDVAKRLGVKTAVLIQHLDTLEQEELILKIEKGYDIIDLREREINKVYVPKMSNALSKEKSKEEQKKIAIASAINETFFQGVMAKSWYNDINTMFSKYHFAEDVMMALFNECNEKKMLKRNYIFKVAETWFLGGVKTFDELEDYLQKQNEYVVLEGRIKSKLRMNRSFTEYEEQYIKTWMTVYKFTFTEVDYAIQKTISKGSPTIGYINGILKKWNEEGLDTLDKIKQSESVKSKEKVASSKATSSTLNHKSYEQRKDIDLNEYYDNM